jgi:hypothetical protein
MNLTANFSVEELTASETALRKGIDNTPDADTLANLEITARGLERIRTLMGHPIHVSSGYRSPKLNAAIGGSKTSSHMSGLAADFTCRQFGEPISICQVIERNAEYIGYQQLINEGRWVHVAFPDGAEPKYEVLTAHFGGGQVKYTRGLS